MTTRGEHASDAPGEGEGGGAERHPHSGPGTPSVPRRSGTGERQAQRRLYEGEDPHADMPMVPGEVLYGSDPVVINAGRDVITLRVENTGDRPVQVGSHYHFAEVNPALAFDREAAWGRRLNVLSGGSMRFEPGAAEQVELIPIAGQRIVAGLRGECGGPLDG
ncbi:MAG: urease subunit beta [Intrasporangium sp.]|uniref:urease subunit beta n=1 Tax=Intrasporangium sp. TaxID=1925024 RepID=UPI003F7DEAB8